MTEALYVGLMSGTSADGIDAALVRMTPGTPCELIATRSHPLTPALKCAIHALCRGTEAEVDRAGSLDHALGDAFAEAALALLAEAAVTPADVAAIGSHGQTVRHRPEGTEYDPAHAFTLQLGDPNVIAEQTGITTVADFRRRDMAAGGQGAPLAPAFHAACFAEAGRRRAIVNIGGIANATLLDGNTLIAGFDCGPGNTLLDHWVAASQGADFDRGGSWSAEGRVIEPLLERCLADPYFARHGPRSTGRELFSPTWLQAQMRGLPEAPPQDVQATLAQLTATAIARSLASTGITIDEVYICGGGAHNDDLMRRLYRQLSPATLASTAALGVDPDWVEAAAFAWLAHRHLQGLPGNAPVVTGARGERVLGARFPGAERLR
jgi:anhydro-N-acetylmuramic acid kinase